MDSSRMSKAQLVAELKKSLRRIASLEAELKRSNERPPQSDELFRLISENAGDLIAVLDLNGRRLYNSPSYREILGDPDKLQGSNSFNEIHPEDREKIQKVFEETVRTGVGQRSEYRFLLRDGTIRYIESMGNLIRDENGNPSKVLVVSRDVTEMRYSDRKIRLLAQTVASTKDCVTISDLDENILFVNDAFLEIFGYTEEELIGRKSSVALAPSTKALFEEKVRPATAKGGWNGTILGRRKDGTEFPQELWTSLVRNESGEPVGIVGVARDISDRMQAEKVQQATYRISEATQSDQSFGELLHTIHEIIGGILPANNFYIALYDEKSGLISFPYFVDEFDPQPEPKKLGKGLTEYVLRTGKPFLATPEMFEELVIAGEVEQIGAPSIDWLGVPLTSDEKTIGVLVVQSYSEGVRFSKLDFEMLSFVSSQVAMSIERRRALESLRESELRFSMLAEAAFEGIALSEKGNIIIASNQLARMFGYEPEDMLGMPALNCVAPESEELVKRNLEDGVTEPYEHLAIRKDGSIFPVEVRARALPYKGRIVRVSVIRDITERKKAQAALENSERRFRALIEHSSDAIGMMDRDGTVVYESPASWNMLGYAPNELTGRQIYDFVHPDEKDEDMKIFSELLNHPGASIAGQFRFKHRTGSWRWLDVVATNLLHEPAVNAIVLNYRDITERKLAQEELYRSQQMLRLVLDNIPQRVFWKDRNFKYLGCNKSFADDAGFQDPSEVVAKNDFELVWKEVAAIYRADDADIMENNTPKINYEEPLPGSDGKTLWLKTSKIPMHDQEGNVIGVLGTYEDVTDRKRAQEEILMQKTRFQQLFENLSLGIAMIDDQDKIVAINPAFSRIFQYDVEGLLGQRINEAIVPPEFAQEGELLSDETRHGKPVEQEGWRRRKDGELVFVRIYGVPIISNGETIGIYGIYEDISQRKRAEDKVREQAALLDVSRDAIGVQDLEGRVLYWNRGAELLYGIPASAIIGKTEVPFYKPDSLSERRQALEKVIHTGEWSGEMRQVTNSGSEITVQSRWSLVRDQNGQPRSILVVATDITEKKKLESQFHHAQRLETIGTLAGGIAHDLNNVLAPILMSIELLETKLTDEKSRRLVSTIESSAKRGSDIVKQVLTFARGVEGERVVLQAKHLLRDMERIALETFPKSIEIRSDLPKNLWTVQGDATQLHQVLLNLCINARDAMPQGGVLEIKAENVDLDQEGTRIHLNARPGRYLAVSVTDTGVGIPAEIMDKIFDPFFTTKEVGKGTGLGLSTVLGIVESHKGFVTVRSEWGKGSEFKVYIPAATDVAADTVRESPVTLPQGGGELILMVDDEASVREIMKASLEAHGYRVVEAKDGMEAAVVYEKQRGDIKLVITDMMMPTMDGAAVIRLLRRMNPAIKIVVVTGMAEEEQISEAMKKTVQGFLLKPFRADKLLKTVHAVLTEECAVE
jgi:PAS domain S-box-containing protein